MADSIKLYLDEDTISRALINALWARNVDILSAHDAGLISVPDSQHLEYATSMGRTVFTHNTRDFAQLHGQWMAQEREHAGIIVSDQIYVGQLVRRLLRLLDSRSADDMKNWLEFLSNWR